MVADGRLDTQAGRIRLRACMPVEHLNDSFESPENKTKTLLPLFFTAITFVGLNASLPRYRSLSMEACMYDF